MGELVAAERRDLDTLIRAGWDTLARCGRRAAIEQLEGPGVTTLAGRAG